MLKKLSKTVIGSPSSFDEMNALTKNGIWEIVNQPSGKSLVGCKWVFTVKYKANDIVECYKTRLVAKGYT